MSGALVIGDGPLTLEAVASWARSGGPVAVSPVAGQRLAAGRRVVERAIETGVPVYGVTTALGGKAVHSLTAEERVTFDRLVIAGRSAGVGEPLPEEIARAALLIRAAGMANGGSGADPRVLDALVAALNAGLTPVVPTTGSVGAGDLVLMAHLTAPLVGAGEACIAGERMPGAAALDRAGLAPLDLGPKDGLTLCNSSAVSAAAGVFAVLDTATQLAALDRAAALSIEGFRGNPSPFDPRVQGDRPAPGQTAAAGRIRRLLAGSALFEDGGPRRVQDPLSIRCLPQVHGALLAALDFARSAVAAELTGGGDNPLVLPEDGAILSTGNFHTAALALSLDALGLAVSQCANLAAERVKKLLQGRLTGLADALAPDDGSSAGFAPLMKTAQALAAEIRHLAAPVCHEVIDVGNDVEDAGSNALPAALKLRRMDRRLGYLVAIELVVAAEAVDRRALDRIGSGAGETHRAVRDTVAPLTADRPLAPDVERLAAVVADGGFSAPTNDGQA